MAAKASSYVHYKLNEYKHLPVVTGNDKNKNLIKMAGFDFDYTLFKPLSSTFPKNKKDFILVRKTIPKILKELADAGYCLVVFSNQKKRSAEMAERIELAITTLSLPIHHVFVSCGDDEYRKPNRGLFDVLTKIVGDIDLKTSFYCGDAGVESITSDSYDTMTDKKFADKIGVEFKLPEQVFPLENKMPSSCSSEYKSHMIILIGQPASGKSSLYENIYKPLGYIHINRDALGTKEKTISAASTNVSSGKNVVIDNTNPSIDARNDYVTIAKKYNAQCDIIYMNIKDDTCKLRNRKRTKKVSNVVYNIYSSNFQFPTTAEGNVHVYDE
jgi:bifunctional polynucleotide phosphatase/kinase